MHALEQRTAGEQFTRAAKDFAGSKRRIDNFAIAGDRNHGGIELVVQAGGGTSRCLATMLSSGDARQGKRNIEARRQPHPRGHGEP